MGFRADVEGKAIMGLTVTRLVSRNRAHMPRTVGSALFMGVLEPAAFIMTREAAETVAFTAHMNFPRNKSPDFAQYNCE